MSGRAAGHPLYADSAAEKTMNRDSLYPDQQRIVVPKRPFCSPEDSCFGQVATRDLIFMFASLGIGVACGVQAFATALMGRSCGDPRRHRVCRARAGWVPLPLSLRTSNGFEISAAADGALRTITARKSYQPSSRGPPCISEYAACASHGQ